jgi:hypothetical protein
VGGRTCSLLHGDRKCDRRIPESIREVVSADGPVHVAAGKSMSALPAGTPPGYLVFESVLAVASVAAADADADCFAAVDLAPAVVLGAVTEQPVGMKGLYQYCPQQPTPQTLPKRFYCRIGKVPLFVSGVTT